MTLFNVGSVGALVLIAMVEILGQGACIPPCGLTRWLYSLLWTNKVTSSCLDFYHLEHDQRSIYCSSHKKALQATSAYPGFHGFHSAGVLATTIPKKEKKLLLYNIQCLFPNTLFQVFLTVALQLEEANKVMILFFDEILQICWLTKHFRWVFWGKAGTLSLPSSSKSSYSKYIKHIEYKLKEELSFQSGIAKCLEHIWSNPCRSCHFPKQCQESLCHQYQCCPTFLMWVRRIYAS